LQDVGETDLFVCEFIPNYSDLHESAIHYTCTIKTHIDR